MSDYGLEMLEFITDTEQILERVYVHLTEKITHEYPNISHTQALLLARVPDEGCFVGEILQKGYSIGTNASYNLSKLVKSGYIKMETPHLDRRRKKILLTKRGLVVKQLVIDVLSKLKNFPRKAIAEEGEK